MMDQYLTIDLMTLNSEVASIISNDHLFSYRFPSLRSVEYLIKVAIESEGIVTHSSAKP